MGVDRRMNIAFLFHTGHRSLGGCYGYSVMERILSANVLQTSTRHMRVSFGDVLTQKIDRSNIINACEQTYRCKSFDRLIHDRLAATYGTASVFCWMFQNITPSLADALHVKLRRKKVYLGAMDVDLCDPLHLVLFRHYLGERFRLRGNNCSIFYSMGSNEDPDVATREIFEKQGFTVEYEDAGARQTIFDNYDNLEHRKRVEDFKRIFGGIDGVGSETAGDLMLLLEDLHPKLFDGFASAGRTLERAETPDDLAQVALSGRRLLEATADYLFPPRLGTWKSRRVGRMEYRNRLWAYIEDTLDKVGALNPALLHELGSDCDRLVSLFNEGLHAELTRAGVEAAFRDLVGWLTRVIAISPAHARRPYLPYQSEILEFFSAVANHEEKCIKN